jgi:hypothetical protein
LLPDFSYLKLFFPFLFFFIFTLHHTCP